MVFITNWHLIDIAEITNRPIKVQ